MKRIGVEKGRLPIFTERFRELQGERSNTEFADFLGISRQTVGFYCNGDRIPDALALLEIAKKCSVSSDWLLGISEAKSLSGEVKQVCRYTGLNQNSIEHLHKIVIKGKQTSLPILFLDSFLNSKIIDDFERSSWRAVASEIIYIRSIQHDMSIDDFYGLEGFEQEEYKDAARIKRQNAEENINTRLQAQLDGESKTSDFMQISPAEGSALYYHRALTLLESAFEDAIADAVDAYRQTYNL